MPGGPLFPGRQKAFRCQVVEQTDGLVLSEVLEAGPAELREQTAVFACQLSDRECFYTPGRISVHLGTGYGFKHMTQADWAEEVEDIREAWRNSFYSLNSR